MTSDEQHKALVREEIPIQSASLEISGGVPSCISLFDDYLLCFAIPNQFKSLYRKGTVADCSAKLDDWKFCLSIKGLDQDQRKAEWIKRKSEMWATRRMQGSSEDIWKAKPYPPGTAHAMDHLNKK